MLPLAPKSKWISVSRLFKTIIYTYTYAYTRTLNTHIRIYLLHGGCFVVVGPFFFVYCCLYCRFFVGKCFMLIFIKCGISIVLVCVRNVIYIECSISTYYVQICFIWLFFFVQYSVLFWLFILPALYLFCQIKSYFVLMHFHLCVSVWVCI